MGRGELPKLCCVLPLEIEIGGGGGALERCAWQNTYSSFVNVQDIQNWILFFFFPRLLFR